MSDEQKQPDPDRKPSRLRRAWWATAKVVLPACATFFVGALLATALSPLGVKDPNPLVEVKVERVEVPVAVIGDGPPGAVEYTPTFGWVENPAVIADNLNPVWTDQFDRTPAGMAVMGDEDVFLWRAVRKVANKGPPWYPNVDQQSVGCCVGCGWKHCTDICQASQILAGKRAEWKPVSVEAIYGASRVEIGGGRISGDGSVGAWAKAAVERYGTLPMEKFPTGHDLTVFSPARAREWGRTGIPDALEPQAKEHPVKGCALVKSWTDVKKAIQQGYPVAVCSNRGFTMERDRDGFARPQGVWNHCMAIIGVRNGAREGGFILNSWGDRAHTGPVWPEDMPVAGFWASADTIDAMVRQGDSFALSDMVGFPARRVPLNWFIRIHGPDRADAFARRLAIRPLEVSLAC